MKLAIILFCVATAFTYGKQLATPAIILASNETSSVGLRGSEHHQDDEIVEVVDHAPPCDGDMIHNRTLAASSKNPTCSRKKACETFLGIFSFSCRPKTYCCYRSHKQWSRCYGFAEFTRYYYKKDYKSNDVRSTTDWSTCWGWSFKGKTTYKTKTHCRA